MLEQVSQTHALLAATLKELAKEKRSARALKAAIVELQKALGITPSYSAEETGAL